MKKYTQGTMATYQGLDPHDDNKWEKKQKNGLNMNIKGLKINSIFEKIS